MSIGQVITARPSEAPQRAPDTESPLMLIPPEIRVMIYEQLFESFEENQVHIRNRPRRPFSRTKVNHDKPRRTSYYVLERTMMRRGYETTYVHAGKTKMYPAILGVNRLIREEASQYLYGENSFHFGHDLEAVVPFFDDKTPSTRSLIKEITVHKRGPCSTLETDASDWSSICHYLRTLPRLDTLKLIIEGGRPRKFWDGPEALSISDLRLLYATRHDCLEWARELSTVDTIGEVRIQSHITNMAEPRTNMMLVHAAFSGSIETTLVEFLRELGVPATAMAQR